MPAWNRRCIVPVKPQMAATKDEERDASPSPARSDTVVASEGCKPQPEPQLAVQISGANRVDADNLPEQASVSVSCERRAGGEGNADADDEAASCPPPPQSFALDNNSTPAPDAQEEKRDLTRKRSSAMEIEPADATAQAEQGDAQPASSALAGTTLFILQQLYSVTPTPSDAMSDSWATTLGVSADEIRRWLAVQHAKDGIVRAPAPKRRKVSHNRSSSDAATLSPAVSNAHVKLESPTASTAGFGVASPHEEAKSTVIGTNSAEITQAPIATPHHDSVSGTHAASASAAPVPIMLPPQPTTVNPSELHYIPSGAIVRPSSSHSTSSASNQNQRPRVSVPVFPRPPSQASSSGTPVSTQQHQLPSSRPQSAHGQPVHPNASWPATPNEHPQMMQYPVGREQRISRPRVDASAHSHQMYPPAPPAGQHPAAHPGPSFQTRRNSATSMTSVSPATPTTTTTPLFPNARPVPVQIPVDGSFVPSQQQVMQALANGMGVYYPPNAGPSPVQPSPLQRSQTVAPSQQQSAALHAAAHGMGVYYPPDVGAPPVHHPPPLPTAQRQQAVLPQLAPRQPQPSQPAATSLHPVPVDAPRFIDQHGRECVQVGNNFFPIEYHPPPSQQQLSRPPMQHSAASQHPAPAPGQPHISVPHQQQRHAPPPHPHSQQRHLAQPTVVVPSHSQLPRQPAQQQIRLAPSQNVAPSQAAPPSHRRSRRMMHNGFETRDPQELRSAPPGEQFEYCISERQHWMNELRSDAANTQPGYAEDCRVRIRAVDAWIGSLVAKGLIAPPHPVGPGPTRPAGAYVQAAAARPNQPQAVSARPPREVIVIPDTPPVPQPQLLEDDAGPSRPAAAAPAVAPISAPLSSQPVASVPLPPQPAAPRAQISSQPISREASAVPSPISVEEQMQQREAVFAYLDACARAPPDMFVPPPALAFGDLASRGERRALVGPYVDEWRRLNAPSAQVLKQIQAHQRRALAPPSPETPAGQLPPSLPAVERELRRRNEVAMDEDDVADQSDVVQSLVEDDGSRALVLREAVNPSHGIVTPDATPEPAVRPAKEGFFKDLMLMLNEFERPRRLEEDGMDATEHMRAVARLHPRPEGSPEISSVEKLDEMLQSHIEKSNYVLAAIERGALSHLGFPPSTSNSAASSSSSPS